MEHLFVSYSGAAGGAERLLLDVLAGLERPAALACPPGQLAEAARAAGIPVRALRPRRLELRGSPRDRAGAPLRIAAQAREVRALVRAERPRCVVAWSMRSLLACAPALARLAERPALVFQHNDFLPGAAIGRAVRRAARSAARVSCLSAAVASELDPDGRMGERLRVIHPGVDAARFARMAPPRDGEPDVLLLGAMVDWKRPDLALEAVALASRELPGLRLTLAGEPVVSSGTAVLEALRERAERDDLRGRVTFAGRVGDVGEALAGASCLLHCADREPFGLALVEALAAGRAVVAPAAGGPVEIVDDSCGRLYPPGDAHAAAAALVEVLSDPARLGQAARKRARTHFSLDRAQRDYRALLDEVAGLSG